MTRLPNRMVHAVQCTLQMRPPLWCMGKRIGMWCGIWVYSCILGTFGSIRGAAVHPGAAQAAWGGARVGIYQMYEYEKQWAIKHMENCHLSLALHAPIPHCASY